jgi:hypothetical protein
MATEHVVRIAPDLAAHRVALGEADLVEELYQRQ